MSWFSKISKIGHYVLATSNPVGTLIYKHCGQFLEDKKKKGSATHAGQDKAAQAKAEMDAKKQERIVRYYAAKWKQIAAAITPPEIPGPDAATQQKQPRAS